MIAPTAYVASVVVYCRDDEALWAETLMSVSRQTLRSVQLLLVGPDAADETMRDLARHSQVGRLPNIGVLSVESPLSARGRNKAIGMTLGGYICELPAGATIGPTMLEKCVWALETEPGAGIVAVDASTKP